MEKAGDLVGFIVCMPDIAPGLRAANGRFFPFGLAHILRAIQRSQQLDVLIGGAGRTAAAEASMPFCAQRS